VLDEDTRTVWNLINIKSICEAYTIGYTTFEDRLLRNTILVKEYYYLKTVIITNYVLWGSCSQARDELSAGDVVPTTVDVVVSC